MLETWIKIDEDDDDVASYYNYHYYYHPSIWHLDDLGSDDGGLEFLEPFAVELLLDFGSLPLLALAFSLLRLLGEPGLLRLLYFAPLLVHSLLLFPLASSVLRFDQLLSLFDNLATLENLREREFERCRVFLREKEKYRISIKAAFKEAFQTWVCSGRADFL